ncbi:hypothetical protein [Streptomyces phaeochromogenes]
MGEVDEVSGGEVAAEAVVAQCRGAVPVGSQGQDGQDALVGKVLGEAAVGAGGGEYEAVDAALEQDVAVFAVEVRVVVGRGDEDVVAAYARRPQAFATTRATPPALWSHSAARGQRRQIR